MDDTLVYLRTSLVAYGNLVVESWYTGDNKLNIMDVVKLYAFVKG